MSYSNQFLSNFRPVFFSILDAKHIRPEAAEILVIDEEAEDHSVFEPADVLDVLYQLAPDLNFLTIYTERPVYFAEYAETMYEENGLIVSVFPKIYLNVAFGRSGAGGRIPGGNIRACAGTFSQGNSGNPVQVVLDFEWEGNCHSGQMRPGRFYIPIHKKPWEMAENLDIIVPIGYNTVIVKGMQNEREEPDWDRFEAAFYSS